MDALQGIFKELYTNFLLRDFAGKIVPGAFLLFSICSIFFPPSTLVKAAAGRVSLIFILLLMGLSWTMVLGLQAVSDKTPIWSYFPQEDTAGKPMNFDAATATAERFLLIANEEERLQYERFVVIKEATGNLFVCCILSLPFWIYFARSHLRTKAARHSIAVAPWVLVCGFAVLALSGLLMMHVQHVHRQYMFAETILRIRKDEPGQAISAPKKPVVSPTAPHPEHD